MPTYEYQCQSCEHTFEVFESITAAPQKKCPACGKLKLKRLIGAGAGLIFKGSGFYQTDYRSDSYSKAAKAESDSSSGKSDKSAEKKTETAKSDAPAAKSEGSSTTKTSKAGDK
ncbi:MAG: zinc ribbon domain-containing protein [Sedimentisphaerales bacterium]|nr:zinc ribbon domain-containing protein [Sedimentisphaerales bacterium]